MKKRLSLTAVAFALSMGLPGMAQAQIVPAAPAPAASAPAPTVQQTKMAACNSGEATGKKGDERKAFKKECLSK